MNLGDLVRIEGEMINGYTWKVPTLGIYLRTIPHDHPSYSPSFPACEILTPRGVRLIQLERVHGT